MNHISTPTAPDDVLTVLRRLLPTRKLRLFEHQVIAEQQAIKLHELLNQVGPPADLGWLTKLKNITVVLQPRWKMDGLSGMSSFDDGHWVIGVNKQSARPAPLHAMPRTEARSRCRPRQDHV